jgi:transcriptional regulator NrdR family protein
MKKQEMGVCPKCGSDDIEYYVTDFDMNTVLHTCMCNKCGTRFTEYEETRYIGYSIDDTQYDEDGNEI